MFGKYRWLLLRTVVAIALGVLSGAAIASDAVLYMSFNQEPDGEVVEDESGRGNHGNIVGNGVDWIADGKFGGALEFDGASKIEIPHLDSLNLSEEMTLAIWFRTEVPQKGRFLIYKIHNGGGRNYQWGIYLTADSTAVSTYVVKPNDEVSTAGKTGDYMDGEWHFLAGTYDGEIIKCYIDGEVIATDWDGELRTGEGSVIIGTWNTNYFTGDLDEACIYDFALSEEEIKSDYENGYTAVNSAGKLSATWAEIKTQ